MTYIFLFDNRYHAERTVMYPSPVMETQDVPAASSQTMSHLQFLRTIAERDPLHEMHDQERKIIWSLRYDCLHHVPHLLPKLLDCVEWNDHTEVCKLDQYLNAIIQ